jgi:hypothetical protein
MKFIYSRRSRLRQGLCFRLLEPTLLSFVALPNNRLLWIALLRDRTSGRLADREARREVIDWGSAGYFDWRSAQNIFVRAKRKWAPV